MRLHIVFVMVLPLQHHIIDKLFVNNKDLTPCLPPFASSTCRAVGCLFTNQGLSFWSALTWWLACERGNFGRSD